MKNLWYLLFLICVSCETIVEVDSPEYDSEPVITSFFSSDSTWSVTMHRSLGASAKLNVLREHISDASVMIMEGSNMADILRYQGDGRYVSTTGVLPVSGIKYTLRVESPTISSIQATSIAPLPVQVTNYSIEPLAPSLHGFSSESNPSLRYQFRVTFSDMTGSNYYRIGVYRFVPNRYGLEESDPDSVYSQIWFGEYSTGWSCGYFDEVEVEIDPVNGAGAVGREVICTEFVVTDRLFDGKNYSWSGTTYDLSRNNGRNELLLIISSLSEDYYEYLKSVERNEFYDPLTQEPSPIYSNVNGGLGVFAGYTNTTLTFPIFQEN